MHNFVTLVYLCKSKRGVKASNETGGCALKILPSSHSTATWCVMVNVSMWCLPTTAHKEWCARYYYRNDKESYIIQRQNPFILLHDVHTNIP